MWGLSKELQKLVRPARFERATPAFGGQYSIQLSYRRYVWGHDSTRRYRPESSLKRLADRNRDNSCQGSGLQ